MERVQAEKIIKRFLMRVLLPEIKHKIETAYRMDLYRWANRALNKKSHDLQQSLRHLFGRPKSMSSRIKKFQSTLIRLCYHCYTDGKKMCRCPIHRGLSIHEPCYCDTCSRCCHRDLRRAISLPNGRGINHAFECDHFESDIYSGSDYEGISYYDPDESSSDSDESSSDSNDCKTS